ncbi:MAG: DNA-processing protein DprA [Hydrogenophaga sp.]
MNPDDLSDWLRLLLTPGVGNDSARRLLAAFGAPQAIWQQSPATLRAVTTPRVAAALRCEPDGFAEALARLQGWLAEGDDRHVITLGDAAYPAPLLQTQDPPLLLYVQGRPEALQRPLLLAMVGSRNPTPQGALNARQFARALGRAGVCIVSGLALGVDAEAHEGALEAGAPTLAVVGTGLDRVYPARHRALAHRIAAQGALISEYPLGTPPLAPNFPRRNRIIAGLAHGTLVVEAALQSGSLITARLAAEQGREVFAIPGSIHSPLARGCHALIRQGAQLVEAAEDILEGLRVPDPLRDAPAQVTPAETGLLACMGFDPVSLDALQARCGLDTATLQARLLELELEGHVGRLPGGLLQRQLGA